ncbi:hypothetical protein D3C86_1642690 [compost metagenome]
MSLQVKQQIVAVVFDRVDADPVDQQGQKGEYQRASYQPFAIVDSHRRTPFFSRRTLFRVATPFLAAEKMIAISSSCRARFTVGASLLAKNFKTMRTFRYPALSLTSIASRLAPTGGNARQSSHEHSLVRPNCRCFRPPTSGRYGGVDVSVL